VWLYHKLVKTARTRLTKLARTKIEKCDTQRAPTKGAIQKVMRFYRMFRGAACVF
jgi:hypothetical protein